MYQLFYFPRNASWAPHMVLRELGVDHELVLVDRKTREQKSEAYLALNPTGRIPTLIDQGQIIFESGAICLHLCEKHPETGLAPTPNEQNRAEFLQQLFYLTTTVQPELMVYFYPKKHTSDPSTADQIKAVQEERVTQMFSLLDQSLKGRNFLVGDSLTLVDFYLFMVSHWASGFKTPPLSFSHLGDYLRQLASLTSIRETCEIEGTDLSIYLEKG